MLSPFENGLIVLTKTLLIKQTAAKSPLKSYRTIPKFRDTKGVYGLLQRMRCSHPCVDSFLYKLISISINAPSETI